jgi:hypothetical protein
MSRGSNADETERLLKQKEMELRKMHELLTQMKLNMANQETSTTLSGVNNQQTVAKSFPVQQPNHNYINMGGNNSRNYENSNGNGHMHSNGNPIHQYLHNGQTHHSYVPTKTNIAASFVLNTSNNSLLSKALNTATNANAHYTNSTPI